MRNQTMTKANEVINCAVDRKCGVLTDTSKRSLIGVRVDANSGHPEIAQLLDPRIISFQIKQKGAIDPPARGHSPIPRRRVFSIRTDM